METQLKYLYKNKLIDLPASLCSSAIYIFLSSFVALIDVVFIVTLVFAYHCQHQFCGEGIDKLLLKNSILKIKIFFTTQRYLVNRVFTYSPEPSGRVRVESFIFQTYLRIKYRQVSYFSTRFLKGSAQVAK